MSNLADLCMYVTLAGLLPLLNKILYNTCCCQIVSVSTKDKAFFPYFKTCYKNKAGRMSKTKEDLPLQSLL